MENIVKIKGRVLDSNENPVENKNIRMAIIDKDSIYDDFIAYGFLRKDGMFDVDVYHSEFNQEPFEHEKYPQIYLLFYLIDAETNSLVPFEKIDKTDVPFVNNVLDLGDIKLNNLTNNRVSKVLTEKFPFSRSLHKNIYLKINDDLVKYCVSDVLPYVEQYTGWNNILDDDIEFIVTNTYGVMTVLDTIVKRYFINVDFSFDNMTKLF